MLMPVQMKISQLAEKVSGKILNKDKNFSFHGIGTDTREDLTGKLFIPFSGENFDAHDFLLKAVERGCSIVLVHKNADVLEPYFDKVGVVEVEDTLKAFQALAKSWRKEKKARVIGITGSNGKTSTKEFAATILEQELDVCWSQKSFNNHWGVPISLLSIEEKHDAALIEMGINQRGELDLLCDLAEPDISLITYVGASHLEGLGSIEGVAAAKETIYSHAPQAKKIFNLDNEYTRKMYEKYKGLKHEKLLTFSKEQKEADVSLHVVNFDWCSIEVHGRIDGVEGSARVPVFGEHHVTNLMAASSIALAVGMSAEKIWSGIAQCQTIWGRGQWYEYSEKKTRVLFDAYNANPESMQALFANLPQKRGRCLAILGEMKELGDHSEEEHAKLGELAAKAELHAVWYVGGFCKAFERGLRAQGFNKKLIISDTYEESLALEFASMLEPDDTVLLKGSRGVALEKVLTAWKLD